MPVDPLRVVRIQLHLDRGQRGRRAGDRDPRLGPRPAPAAVRAISPRTSLASASSSSAVGGSEAMWRSVWRTTPACSEAWKEIFSPRADDQLGRAAADVDDQRRTRGHVLRGGAEVGEPRLLLAVEDARREREPLPQLGDEGASVAGVPDRAGRDRVDPLRAQLPDHLDVLADRLADRLDRLRGQLPGEIDPAPQPRHPAAPLDRRNPPPDHVGHQQPSRVGADVDRRDPCGSPPTWPGTLCREPCIASMGTRRGVEQPGSSSGS